jgi:hypothetical protein
LIILHARKSLTSQLAQRFPGRFAVAYADAVQRVANRHTGRGRPDAAAREVEAALTAVRRTGDAKPYRSAHALLPCLRARQLLAASNLDVAMAAADQAGQAPPSRSPQ